MDYRWEGGAVPAMVHNSSHKRQEYYAEDDDVRCIVEDIASDKDCLRSAFRSCLSQSREELTLEVVLVANLDAIEEGVGNQRDDKVSFGGQLIVSLIDARCSYLRDYADNAESITEKRYYSTRLMGVSPCSYAQYWNHEQVE